MKVYYILVFYLNTNVLSKKLLFSLQTTVIKINISERIIKLLF